MTNPHPDLLGLLDIDQLAADLFVAQNPQRGRTRVYGGQVVAQALAAAMATLDDPSRPVHSLHSYFIRPGDESKPIAFDVDRIRDGRSFTTRRVVGRQTGGAIFNLSASFHSYEPDAEVSPSTADLDVPPPEECVLEEWDDVSEIRMVPESEPGRARAWIRIARPERLPDDPALHNLAIAYSSDHVPMDAIANGHPAPFDWDDFMGASLDHSLWFHRPARGDEWLLFDCRLLSLAGSRGIAQGTVHTASGTHVATLTQEGLLRRLRHR